MTRRRRSPHSPIGVVIPLLSLLFLACSDGGTGPGPAQEITELPRALSSAEVEVIRASNRFGFDVVRHVSHPDSNLFFSPLSASMALGMTMNGAAGETFTQMREVLGFDELPREEINASYRDLIELLTGLDPTVELGIANSVWIRDDFPVLASFEDEVREFFGAEVANLDLGDPSAAETMNAWVREATNGRIDEIIEAPIDPLTTVFLINAVFFKGTWTTQFDPGDTHPAPFHLPDGSTVEVEMMEAEEVPLDFVRTPEYVAGDLPYGGEAFSMTVVVPSEEVGLEAFVEGLDAEAWAELVEGLGDRKLDVFLPRFILEWERELNDDLIALGMVDAFDPTRADLSRMAEGARKMELHVREVKQKSFVEVNEEGTEAAAATSVGVGPTSAPPTLRVDRPFLFVLRERLSGTILFVGKVMDPTREG